MKKSSSWIIGGIVIAVTILVFALTVENLFKVPMCWIALIGLILLEVVTTYFFGSSEGNPKKVGAAIAFLIGTVVAIPISLLFINLLPFEYKWYIVLYVIIVAVAFIAAYLILRNNTLSEAAAVEFKSAKASMLRSRAAVNAMINSEAGKNYAEILAALEEDLKYSNDAVISEMDDEIYSSICELSEKMADEEDVVGRVAKIRNDIKQREFLVKNRVR